VHMGRKDFQVKIRGQRVEVGEVESALLDLPSVRTAAVHAQARAGEQYLVGYVVPAARPAPTASELRRALLATLPAYMVPAHFVFLDALPVSPTGKTDRRALPAPDRERPPLDAAFVAPRTPIESALARIWAEVLDRERVGVHDDFLDLGGHSLLAGQVLARVEQVLPVGLTMQVLATAPTVAELAAAILELCLASGDPGAIQRLLARAEAWSDEAEPVGGEPVSTSDPAAEERS